MINTKYLNNEYLQENQKKKISEVSKELIQEHYLDWINCVNYKESWVPNNWRFWTVVLEKTLESPLDCKEIKPVNLKGNQSRLFIGRIDAEAEALIFWPPDAKNWPTGKDPGAGKD